MTTSIFKKFAVTIILVVVGSLIAVIISYAGTWNEPTTPPPGGGPSEGAILWKSAGPGGLFSSIFNTNSGNVGIGTTAPAQKLSVAGIIESTTGGIKFPDGTTQTTAAAGGASQWTTLGSDILYNVGKVGIGTTSLDPAFKITTLNGGIKTENNDFNNPAGYFANKGGGPALFADGSFKATSIIATQRIASAYGQALYIQNPACSNPGTIVTNETCMSAASPACITRTVSGNSPVSSTCLSTEHLIGGSCAHNGSGGPYGCSDSHIDGLFLPPSWKCVTQSSCPLTSNAVCCSSIPLQNTMLGRLIFDNVQVLPGTVAIDTPVFNSTNNLIALSWSSPSTPVTSFKIYRGTTSGGETYLATTDKLNYVDTAINPGIPYYYKVSVVNVEGEGVKSLETQGTIFGIRLIASVSNNVITIDEGKTNMFNLSLNYKPIGNVVVKIVRASGDTDISISVSTYTFTPDNWNAPQPVTLSVANDTDAINSTAVINISSTSGGAGQNIIEPIPSINITATENDREVIILNSASSKSCDAICQSGAGICESVGTDVNGVSGTTKNWSVTQCVTNPINCSTSMPSDGKICDGRNSKWTNCRCAKWPALGTVKLSNEFSTKFNWSYQDLASGGLPVTGYNIYRGSSSDNKTLLATVTSNVTSYTDSTNYYGTNFYYQVSAVNSTGADGSPLSGPKSNEIQIMCLASGAQYDSGNDGDCNGVAEYTVSMTSPISLSSSQYAGDFCTQSGSSLADIEGHIVGYKCLSMAYDPYATNKYSCASYSSTSSNIRQLSNIGKPRLCLDNNYATNSGSVVIGTSGDVGSCGGKGEQFVQVYKNYDSSNPNGSPPSSGGMVNASSFDKADHGDWKVWCN